MVGLLGANAFFVMAEYAFVRVRETQLQEIATRSRRARLALRIVGDLGSYVSASQVGVTLANLMLGYVGEPALARLVEPLFGWLIALSEPLFHALTFAITFGLITYLTLVLSELAPKQIAMQAALPLALWCAYPLETFRRVMHPFVAAVNVSACAIVRLLGLRTAAEESPYSEQELRLLVEASARGGVLQESERVILGNALSFADRTVRQVMVPRTEMVALPEDSTPGAILGLATKRPYSRFPVYRDTIDQVVGVLHLRDLALKAGTAAARDLVRPVPMIPELTHIDRALADLRRQRASLAIAIDEFGGTAGLVTVEDILEELIGEVQDEFDREGPAIREQDPDVFMVIGLASLDDLRERLGVELEEDERTETVGGFVFSQMGRVPVVRDVVRAKGWRFEVAAMDGRRVAQLLVTRDPKVPAAADR